MLKMRKAILASAAVAMALTLAGCKDASAKLKDSSTVLFTVGKKKVTKGNVYETMVNMAGASTAINNATNTIASQEVEITDDIKAQAESTLNTYKSMYGDTFTSYLEQSNMSEDDYLNDYLIPSLLASQLTDKYIEAKWDDLISMYKPCKATVLSFTSLDDANAALDELKAGTSDAATAASNHNSSSDGTSEIYTTQSSSLDSMVRAILSSLTPDDGWNEVTGSDGSTYYLVKVDSNDTDSMHDDIVSALSSISNVSSDATTYYFRKYKFHVYDITLYNAIKASYPDNLVQDMAESTASAEASFSASASASASASSSN
ncbi:hypothetical protein [Lactimicrobium massiliense]|uniref:hypothetical protein n=1 Tax=Lactimicrobium massiliense TaxID=2161814 RepID=UPI000D55C631|nr:hypothetical protein [Lactimicrobium massiliense]